VLNFHVMFTFGLIINVRERKFLGTKVFGYKSFRYQKNLKFVAITSF